MIQVENSVRRLARADSGANRLEVIRDAILEVRKPTLFGELIIIIVYLPVLALQGVEGKLFRPMALTVVLVLIGSLILSFTVIPALVGTLLSKRVREREPVFVHWLKRLYEPIVDRALRHAKAVLIAAAVLVIAGVGLFTRLGSEFVPRLSEGTIVINFVRLAGISLPESVDYNTRIEKLLLETFPDEISHIWTRTGTAELSTDPMGLELSDMFISLTPRSQWTRANDQAGLVAAIDAELDDLPGQKRIFTQPIEMRINEMIAGIRSDIGSSCSAMIGHARGAGGGGCGAGGDGSRGGGRVDRAIDRPAAVAPVGRPGAPGEIRAERPGRADGDRSHRGDNGRRRVRGAATIRFGAANRHHTIAGTGGYRPHSAALGGRRDGRAGPGDHRRTG